MIFKNMKKILINSETDYNSSKQTINVYVQLEPVYTFKENIVMKIEE